MDVDGDFTISGVVRLTGALLRRDVAALAGLVLLLLVLPQALAEAAEVGLAGQAEGKAADLVAGLPSIVLWLADVAFKGAAIHAALAGTAARPVRLGGALGRGLAGYPGNLVLMALVSLGIAAGTLCLVVPGIVLQCRWLAALPAKLGERCGVRDAMARSGSLAEGHRSAVFGLVLCFAVSDGIAAQLAALPVRTMGAAGGFAALALEVLVAALFAAVSSVGSAAVYLELRRVEGGTPSADVVEAFA